MSSVYLGIDYGAKRVGLSHADGLGFAFPLPAAVASEAEEEGGEGVEHGGGLIKLKPSDRPSCRQTSGLFSVLNARLRSAAYLDVGGLP